MTLPYVCLEKRTESLVFQPSLRDWIMFSNPTQDSRPGLSSGVPAGLNLMMAGFHADPKSNVFLIIYGPTNEAAEKCLVWRRMPLSEAKAEFIAHQSCTA